MKYRVIILCFFLFSTKAFAQTLPYAKQLVQILTSDSLHGRGYVQNGEQLAASFIAQEFEKIGVEPINQSYFQPFQLSINTFPGASTLYLGDEKLKSGVDFLISPGSPSVSGTFSTVWIDGNELFLNSLLEQKLANAPGKFLVINPGDKSDWSEIQRTRFDQIQQFLLHHPNNLAAGTLFLNHEKLTWYSASNQDPKPSIFIDRSSVQTPFEEITIEVDSDLKSDYTTQNVWGKIKGLSSDSVVVLMAHYDHFGKMGEAIFPGANDNASGVAMLLSLANYFKSNPIKYDLVFLAFGAEEQGLLGSTYFINNAPYPLEKTAFYLNFDIAGTGDEGIQVVNGSVYRKQFDHLKSINDSLNYLPQVKIRGAACNSDHCVFDQKNIPGFYMYTLGGIRAYHDVFDRFETLPFTKFEEYFNLITTFLSSKYE